MAQVSLGDMAQAFTLRRQNMALKAELETRSNELTTGRVADLAARVKGDFAPLNAIDATLSRLGAYGAATTETGLFSEAMQSALTTIDMITSDLSPLLLNAAFSANPAMVDTLGADAMQKFETAISALNTRIGDRTVFAGQATQGPALIDAQVILTALDTAISGALNAPDVVAAVTDWFDAPGGYLATAYLGGAALAPLAIAQGETASLSISAADPEIRDTLKGLAMAALLDRGALAGAPTARAELASLAGESLVNSQIGRTNLAARLGIVEAQIETAKARNGAETSALQIARVGIGAVDPFEAASKLEAAQTQLETLYTLTARLSRLNLADFLR